MADNITLMDGAGGQLASNDVDGVQVLRCKLQVGIDGEASDVSEVVPLPIRAQAAGLSVFQTAALGTTGCVVKSSPGVAATAGSSDADTQAPSGAGVVVSLFYR